MSFDSTPCHRDWTWLLAAIEWTVSVLHLVVEGSVVELTDSGFLVKTSDWNESVAQALAQASHIGLTDEHWEIIHLIRQYYFNYLHLPNARMFVKLVQKSLGEDKGNSRYLHSLFPNSAVRFACLIAGLPKPPGCL